MTGIEAGKAEVWAMRRRLATAVFALALAFVLTRPAGAVIAHVASVSAGSTGGNDVTTGAIDSSGATLLVASVSWIGGAPTPPTLTDSKGNTWTPLTAQSSGSGFRNKLYYTTPTSVGASHTFTATSTGLFPTVSVSAFSGVRASPFDQETGSLASTNVTSLATGSLTPSENNCLVVVGATTFGTTHTINGGFSAATTNASGGNHMGGGVAYLIQTTAAAANPTWSWSGASEASATIAVFKAAGGAAPRAMHHSRLRRG